MVSTRKGDFPLVDATPSKTPGRQTPPARAQRPQKWTYVPDQVTLIWLYCSLPLVIWDFIYVFGRPYTMAYGFLNRPLYIPYNTYAKIDYVYGQKAWLEHDGFTAAQSSLNVLETLGYLGFLYTVWKHGNRERKEVAGHCAGIACLSGFALSIMTGSKTVLYVAHEAFSGFANIGHNDPLKIIFAWILPNGAWIVFPVYMAYVFASDILLGLSIASGDTDRTPAKKANSLKDD